MRKLGLAGAPNARDLGGIQTEDGRTVRPAMLIRSGELSRLTEADRAALGAVPLKTVVDFRTERERAEKPDAVIPGVTYVACPILEQMSGITREQASDEIPAFFRAAIAAGAAAEDRMTALYLPLVESDYSTSHYAEFLRLVLAHEGGALLYHCTAGKDRVGVGTMLILEALGVTRETILEDYLLTNACLAPETEQTVATARRYSDAPDTAFAIWAFDSARERYIRNAWASIDRNFGSTQAFLARRLGFGAHEVAALREKYLV